MRLNADTTLTSPSYPAIRLVPYTARHVPTYHAWMEDADLRTATGSERLTADEEVAMQRAWAEDEDKLTFIALDAEKLAAAEERGLPRAQAELEAMVGDVNLFLLQDQEEEGGDGDGGPPGSPAAVVGEIEIMIAVRGARCKGFGAAAVRMLVSYARTHVGLTRVVAKIGRSNAASLSLFTNRLGFRITKEVPVFDEVHLAADPAAVVVVEEEVAGSPGAVVVVVEGGYGAWLAAGGGGGGGGG